ncbi:TPA: aminopeptidase [candidate division WOR-3 bacterium]|jgi:endoglucanase|uniref:Aminopeptidase n=1 Tax=candidate division WOR-3 bacterium TaxID=2052148 RepID=A0A350H9C4_UNCW3|nr:aminopeptidase [candidate division WOR-3 bacterium]
MKQLIRALTDIIGPSSYEELVADYIEKILKKNKTLEIRRDAMGNLIARRKGNGKKIMLAAHMDEIGFMVKHIDKNGFLRFAVVGGIFNHNIIENHVKFTNGVEGVIGIEPKSFNWKDVPAAEKMFIDIGAKSRAEAEKLVSIGSLAGMKATFVDMGKRISTKTLDDRIGCAMLMEIAKQDIKGKNDIYFVFTTQEEVGLRGAKTSAFGISPDFAIAIDVTDTGDLPESHIMEVSLGKGPAIKVMDAGMVVRKPVIDFMKETAEKNKIPYQLEILQGGSTDAMAIQTNKDGVLAGVISIPTRYIHSQAEMCDMDDVENGTKLIKEMVEIDLSKRGF